jgi:hypothetical protein
MFKGGPLGRLFVYAVLLVRSARQYDRRGGRICTAAPRLARYNHSHAHSWKMVVVRLAVMVAVVGAAALVV